MGQHREAIKTAIKDEFLGHFRRLDAKPGDVLPVSWLYDDFMASLSPQELKALEEVVNEMIHDDLIEYVGGAKPTYSITDKGFRGIF